VYDVIVVGARCAGAPTAMLLARLGYKVLILDRAHFPSDTISTLYIQPAGVDRLVAWGILNRLAASGCPPLPVVRFWFDEVKIAGHIPEVGSVAAAYAPRRYILDSLLVEAAQESGADFLAGCSVTDIVWHDDCAAGVRFATRNDGGKTERARLIVGDGRHSTIAKYVGAERYIYYEPISCSYYGFWPAFHEGALEIRVNHNQAATVMTTNDGLSLVSMAWPREKFPVVRRNLMSHFLASLRVTAPAVYDGLDGYPPIGRLVGTADLPNFYRRSAGPGWALVGDAGCHKDPASAQGITDAFLQAEILSQAIHQGFSGRTSMDEEMTVYARRRDQMTYHTFRAALQNARFEVPPDLMTHLRSIEGDCRKMDLFIALNAGAITPDEFMQESSDKHSFLKERDHVKER
jgi:flavin-dependent dehydrogenase